MAYRETCICIELTVVQPNINGVHGLYVMVCFDVALCPCQELLYTEVGATCVYCAFILTAQSICPAQGYAPTS
jgi:hypothetical protein